MNKSKFSVGDCVGEWEIIKWGNNKNLTVRSTYNGVVREKVTLQNLMKGEVANPYKPSLLGVGFLGEGPYSSREGGKKTKSYTTWVSMMSRCYNKSVQEKQPTYIGCSVDERWHNFQTFCEDIKSLVGYDEWVSGERYELDKDIKVEGNKVYSKDSCMFVTKDENVKQSNKVKE